jgi:hypothetical protein
MVPNQDMCFSYEAFLSGTDTFLYSFRVTVPNSSRLPYIPGQVMTAPSDIFRNSESGLLIPMVVTDLYRLEGRKYIAYVRRLTFEEELDWNRHNGDETGEIDVSGGDGWLQP